MKVKDAPVPSCQLILEELASVGIYINFNSKIQPKAPILPLLPTPIIDAPEYTSFPPVPARLFHLTPSPRRPHSQIMETLKRTTALSIMESMTFKSCSQLKFTVFTFFSLTKAAPDSHDAVLDTK